MTRSTLSVLVLLGAFALLCWLTPHVVLVIFAGALVAVGLRSLAAPVAIHLGLRGGWAVLLVSLALVLLFGVAAWAVAAPLSEQAGNFAESLPRTLQSLREQVSQYGLGRWVLERVHPEQMIPSAGDAAGLAAAGLSGGVGVLGDIVLVVLLGIFLAAEPSLYRRGAVALLAPALRPGGMYVLDQSGAALRGWLIGAMCAMAFNGTLVFLGLWALGVPLSGLLGVIAGLMSFVPYIGAFVAAVPAALVALGQDPSLLPWALGLFCVVEAIEGNVLTPMVQKHTTDLPPGLLLAAQALAGASLGVLGIILAAPLAAVAMTAIRAGYVEQRLEGEN
ncbi:AI-2E family transporter [Roseomonas sp. BN140053]|uniref:AI-2E family transporter n=1 Tax=Roseomonas sp. BN140053 TaxID=3391898 RepID=UPI0039E84A5C